MPKYMMLIVEDESAYAQATEAQMGEVMAMHGEFAKAVADAGASMVGGEALQPRPTATYLRGTRTPEVAVVDNPLPDVKEAVGGFYVIEAADDATARTLAEQCPAPYGFVELRPVWEFGG